jgi:hypothetical protein
MWRHLEAKTTHVLSLERFNVHMARKEPEMSMEHTEETDVILRLLTTQHVKIWEAEL